MTIPAPAIQWPLDLRQKGPKNDPTILFVGQATVAGAAFTIAALRVRKDGHGPDFHDDIPEEEYEDSLESMMESVEDLAGSIRLSTIPLNGEQYVLWMVPNSIRG